LPRRKLLARSSSGEGETPMGADPSSIAAGRRQDKLRRCAACAASASWFAPAMWRSLDPLGFCTRASLYSGPGDGCS
jgi:hypothetical protein